MNVDLIRDTFSYATVSLSNNTISLIYDASQEKYWSQDFDYNTIENLTNLISVSERICIYPFREQRMVVVITLPSSSQFPWAQSYPAKKRLLSYEEIADDLYQRAVQNGITDEDIQRNTQKLVNNVDLRADNDTILEQLGELIVSLDEDAKLSRPISLQSHQNYPYFKKAAIDLMKYIPTLDICLPQDDMPGSVEINLSVVNQLVIHGDMKKRLCNILEYSKGCDISCDLGMKEFEVFIYS